MIKSETRIIFKEILTSMKMFALLIVFGIFPVDIYLLKFNNRNTTARYEICSKSTIKTPERSQA